MVCVRIKTSRHTRCLPGWSPELAGADEAVCTEAGPEQLGAVVAVGAAELMALIWTSDTLPISKPRLVPAPETSGPASS